MITAHKYTKRLYLSVRKPTARFFSGAIWEVKSELWFQLLWLISGLKRLTMQWIYCSVTLSWVLVKWTNILLKILAVPIAASIEGNVSTSFLTNINTGWARHSRWSGIYSVLRSEATKSSAEILYGVSKGKELVKQASNESFIGYNSSLRRSNSWGVWCTLLDALGIELFFETLKWKKYCIRMHHQSFPAISSQRQVHLQLENAYWVHCPSSHSPNSCSCD